VSNLAQIVSVHARYSFNEWISHAFLDFVAPLKAFISCSRTLERIDFVPVVGRAHIGHNLVHFIVVQRLTLELFKLSLGLLVGIHAFVVPGSITNKFMIVDQLHTLVHVS
jgi:hypothetical protein